MKNHKHHILDIGHKDKSLLVDETNYKQVFRKAAWISATVLVNGRVEGTWTRKKKTKSIDLTIEPFRKFDRNLHDAIEQEVARLAQFYNVDYQLKYS